MATAAGIRAPQPAAAATPPTALVRYNAGASFEDKVAFLTERLAALDQAGEWKLAVKRELAGREYSLEQLQSSRGHLHPENPMLFAVLKKLGLVSALKRAVIELHYAAKQTAAAASEKQVEQEGAFLIPELQSSSGCALDVVLRARDNWEAITRDEMLRFASEIGRPLVAEAASPAAASSGAPSQSSDLPKADQLRPDTKVHKAGAARFLYDG